MAAAQPTGRPDSPLPCDVFAERCLLGSVLLAPQHWTALAELEPDHFSREDYRRIFAALGELATSGADLNTVTLRAELARRGHLESVNGLSGLVDLTAELPHFTSLDSYVDRLKRQAALRRIIAATEALSQRAYLGIEAPEKLAESLSSEAQRITVSLAKEDGQAQTAQQVVENFPGGIGAVLDPTHRPRGITTGFTKLDEMTGGFKAGEYIIVGARPSVGKTALALNIAQHVALHPQDPRPVLVFSMEMSNIALLDRLMCSIGRVDQHTFRAGYLNRDERTKLQWALGRLVDAPLYLDDATGVSVASVVAKANRLMDRIGQPLGLVVIDYIGLMEAGRQENRNQQVSAISRGLKLAAKDMGCPFLVLSQLSRANEKRGGDHQPQLSDLRDSGSIEQDADTVLFVHREEMYHKDREDLRGLADLIAAKQRNGPIGIVPLRFLGQYTRFENRVDELPPEPPEERY